MCRCCGALRAQRAACGSSRCTRDVPHRYVTTAAWASALNGLAGKLATFGQSGVDDRVLHVAPLLCVRLTDDENVDRNPERRDLTTEPHHLGVTIRHVTLDHQKV